jgi:prepilin-type N-terminal cleavage/methylation domain-containing protein
MKISPNKSRGFTLVELLVTISIIALLSSIILVSLNGARQKGTVGSAIEFADNVYHKLGVNTILSMNFNEGSGEPNDQTGNFIRRSGYTLNDTTYSNSTPFSDNGDSLSIGSSFDLPMINNYSVSTFNLTDQSGLTVSIWANTLSTDNITNTAYNLYYITSNTPSSNSILQGYYSNYYVICKFLGNISGQSAVYMPSFNDGNWHNVTCSYDVNSGNLMLYVDGVLKSTTSVSTAPGTVITGINNVLYVGSAGSGAGPFLGLIDNFQIFSGSIVE